MGGARIHNVLDRKHTLRTTHCAQKREYGIDRVVM